MLPTADSKIGSSVQLDAAIEQPELESVLLASSPAPMTILVGTASWTDKSLIDSGKFYPKDRLLYYHATL